MKIKHIMAAISCMALAALLTGCKDKEKDLIIVEDDLPIKTETLYMVGDATPSGWNIDSPTPLTATKEDPLVFVWEGELITGEMKLCLVPGSWDAPFIRPMEAGTEIGKATITDAEFQMHAGDPDEKWRVTAVGKYSLKFDLRNWTMSSTYVGEQEIDKTPIETDVLYMIGGATEGGWSLDAATEMTVSPDNKYIFTWEGALVEGEMKACTVRDFNAEFVRPSSPDCEISSKGVAANDFIYTKGPDDKWKVTEAGMYKITFDLENYTIAVEYKGEISGEDLNGPIETEVLYMIGGATEGGWSLDAATELTVSPDNKYIFTWEGTLIEGDLKACIVKDFGAKFIRPSYADCEISSAGVAATDFVYTRDPDDKWKVTEAGKYKLTFDLENYTIGVEYKGGISNEDENAPIETEVLYMIGDATPGGWSLDDAAAYTVSPDNKYIFSWEGKLNQGTFKACVVKDFGAKFIRPSSANCEISSAGVAATDFVYTRDPDDQWKVTEAGMYRITFDLENYTIAVEYKGAGEDEGGDNDDNNGKTPIETEVLYMIGDATPGGWSLDDAAAYTVSPDNKYIFSWEGKLNQGTFKACVVKDFGADFIRPSSANCEISSAGVAANDFVYTKDPDDQWKVTEAGIYRITFDLENYTIAVEYKGTGNDEGGDNEDNNGKTPIETEVLYMIGDATPGGWSLDDAAAFTVSQDNKYIFTWEGQLNTGELKVCIVKDFGADFIRPSSANCEISSAGVAANDFVYTKDPDDKWKVTEAGKYRLTFDLEKWTIKAEFLNN